MMPAVPNAWYDEPPRKSRSWNDDGAGLDNVIACVEAMKKVLGSEIGLALDCGPGWTGKDAITFAHALEPLRIAWLEALITGDYTPYPNAELFREVTVSTTIPIHTGEEIYLRENFKDLIEKQAANIVGPDPEDVGGIAEMKWIAEYAVLHGIQIAPMASSTGFSDWPPMFRWLPPCRKTTSPSSIR
jgi:L-alanine-DL-glutamate epimerase-like enolase superfamily enzyme